jgi:hypothetical protein
MWLIKRVQQTAIAQGQLQLLLQDAEIQAFLHQVPAAGRILRPLCTAVGLALPETLRRPPRTPKPRPPPPEPPRHGKYKRFSLRRYRPGKPTIAFPKPP